MLLLAFIAVGAIVFAIIAWRFGSGRRRAAFREIAFIVVVIFAYFGIRGLTQGELESALAHARLIVGWEKSLAIFIEPTVQASLADNRWVLALANWVYIWGHWPVIAFGALYIYARLPSTYQLYRDAFFISGAIGFSFFLLFPTAPPRFLDVGLVDLVAEYSHSYRVLQPPSLVNELAAFPSLHFGWNLLLGLALASRAEQIGIRAFGAIFPAAMLLAVVVTGNHYILDAVAGAAVALIGLASAYQLQRYRRKGKRTLPGVATA